MAQFKNLADLEKYLQKNLHQVMNKSAELERVLASAMSQSVFDVVYTAYDPITYERRMDDHGLSDERNMSITSVSMENNSVRLVFENLTEGNDSQRGVFIADMIEEGIRDMWDAPNSPYSDPRRFVAETIKRLQDNPTELMNAIRNGLISKGMKIK